MKIHDDIKASQYKLADGKSITIRSVSSQDENMQQAFAPNLVFLSKHFRYMENFNQLKPENLLKFSSINDDHEMVLIAIYKHQDKESIIGLARYAINPNEEDCEFALLVAENWQHKGIGSILMSSLLRAAQKKELKTMIGLAPSNNTNMLQFAKKFDFLISDSDETTIKILTKLL